MLADGGFLYSSDSYADDLPYWVSGADDKPHLIIPYTLDANDMRFINPQGFADGESFFTYLRDSFDVLYHEGETAPKMMSVGLRCRLAGRPGPYCRSVRFSITSPVSTASRLRPVWTLRDTGIANILPVPKLCRA